MSDIPDDSGNNTVVTNFPQIRLNIIPPKFSQIESTHRPIRFRLLISTDQIWFELPADLRLSRYRVSKDRRIKNSHGRILSNKSSKAGYIQKCLCNDDGRRVNRFIHRLVALTFIPNPENKPVVDHINREPSDNRVENLRWATFLQNIINRDKPTGQIKSKHVLQKTIEGEIIKIWSSAKEAAENVGTTNHCIMQACRRGNKCQGFRWAYYVELISDEEWKELIISAGITIGVSSHGRIRTASGKTSYGHLDPYGYHMAHANKKLYSVHRLVCMAFDPNPDYLRLDVNHKDRNKSNNNILNLEWCTRSENIQHYRRASNRDGPSMIGRPVKQLTMTGEAVDEFCSAFEVFRQTGIDSSAIGKVCKGKRQMAGGFKWEYITNLQQG